MSECKTVLRFFTIADYEEEEQWLHQQHSRGWKLVKMIPPCFYRFEKCQPEDVVYRLDYQNGQENGNYFQMFHDYGWEYLGQCVGWLYFRKSAAQGSCQEDSTLFSDNASKLDLITRVCKTRLLPLLGIFLCCIVPNFISSIETHAPGAVGLTVFFSAATVLYGALLLYCRDETAEAAEKIRRAMSLLCKQLKKHREAVFSSLPGAFVFS